MAVTGEFRLGPWVVDPASGELRHDDGTRGSLQPKVLAVLVTLAEADGGVVSRQELVDKAWEGRPTSDEPINRCITELRSALGDDRSNPRYIRTVPKRGYQLVIPVKQVATNPAGRRKPYHDVVNWLVFIAMTLTLVAVATWYSTSTPAPHERRVLVLPVEAPASGDVDDTLATSLTDALIDSLGWRGQLNVMSRATGEAKQVREAEMRRIHDLTGADYVVESALTEVEGDSALSVRLYDARQDEILLFRYVKFVNGLSSGHVATVSTWVADAIGTRIREIPPAAAPPSHFNAYRYYLEGQRLWQEREPAAIRESIDKLRLALASSPDNARVHANLAAAYLMHYNFIAPEEQIAGAVRRHVGRALELAPDNALALAIDAVSREEGRVSVIQGLEQALEINPNLHFARTWYAQALFKSGYIEQALEQVQSASRQDPFSSNVHAWRAYLEWLNGNPGVFRPLLARLQQEAPAAANRLAAFAALGSGNWDRAARLIAPLLGGDTGEVSEKLQLLFSDIASGRRGAATSRINAWQQGGLVLPVSWEIQFRVLAGDIDTAAAMLLDADEPGSERLAYLFWHGYMAPLRQHPEFPEIARHFDLLETWQTFGEHPFCQAGDEIRCR